jgi:hypothetical protein
MWVVSAVVAIAIGLYAARGDPINPYRKTFPWENYLEITFSNFVEEFFF